jgi:beta-glucanase (GH16 family)
VKPLFQPAVFLRAVLQKFSSRLMFPLLLFISITCHITAADAITNLVWSDDFNGTNIDLTKWTFDTGNNNGWGNNELEFYTSRTNNAYVTNGMLHIRAIKENTVTIATNRSGVITTNIFRYTSARMKTQNLFWKKYGQIEWRAKLPAGTGMWPALWALGTNFTSIGWPACGEIDVVENDGANPTFVQGSIHSGTDGTDIFNFTGDSVTNFHVYDLIWSTNFISFVVDGTTYETQTSWGTTTGNPYPFPFNQPFYFLMNLAVGGDYVGDPSTNSINPSIPGELVIDYMYVFDDVPVLQPGIVSVVPSNGCLAGGTLITLTGTNFVLGATVSVAGLPASGVTVYNSNLVTCITPPSVTASSKAVSLQNPGGGNALKSKAFTYLAGPAFGGLVGATPAVQGATLTWSAATGGSPPILYNVYEGAASGAENFNAPLLTTNSLSAFISSLDPGIGCTNTYYFVVRAVDQCNSSDNNSVEFAVQPTTVPLVFAGLTSVTANVNTATLVWSAASGGTPPYTYNVFQATASGAENFASPLLTTNDVTVSVPVIAGSNSPLTYFFVVRVQGGCSIDSNAVEQSVQPPLDPNGDQTGNGIPNWWLQQYGMDPFDTNVAAADADGDGISNLQEFLSGTDPTNPASYLHIISITPQDSDVLIAWMGGGGTTNIVQSTADLTLGYSNISGNIILSGTGDSMTNYVDPGAATNNPQQYYRIQLVP